MDRITYQGSPGPSGRDEALLDESLLPAAAEANVDGSVDGITRMLRVLGMAFLAVKVLG